MSENYDIYEVDEDGNENWIAGIITESDQEAIDRAKARYGAPIVVKQDGEEIE